MNIFESILTGIREIFNHKFQSFLTMLGVIFGVSAVIAMVSIGEGAKKEALLQLKKLGTNTVIINRSEGKNPEDIIKNIRKSPYGLNISQYKVLQKILPINASTALREASGIATGIVLKPDTYPIIGCFANLPEIASLEIDSGRFISEKDNNNQNKVCVLGSEAARKLFHFHSPIGKKVKIEANSIYTCVGVLKTQQVNTLFKSIEYNDAIYIPLRNSAKDFSLSSTLNAIRQSRYDKSISPAIKIKLYSIGIMKSPADEFPISSIILKLQNSEDYKKVRDIAQRYLLNRNLGVENFEIIIPLELIKQQQKTQDLFNMIMVAIASISLLVGGIGIMNIMLATVTQRTNEIGIRRCLGATKANILIQFVIESLIITMIGGAIGVLLGIILSWRISFYAKWPTVISYSAIIYAVLVSVSVGIIFGLYPAWKAASTDPIKALKFE